MRKGSGCPYKGAGSRWQIGFACGGKARAEVSRSRVSARQPPRNPLLPPQNRPRAPRAAELARNEP
jgi:hypothetical protein